MVGLLLKDFYSMAKTVKTYMIIIVLYAIIFGLMDENGTAVIAVSGIIVAMAPITALAYDEQSKFDKLAGTMPVSPKQIVLSKYILGFLLCLFAIVISSILLLIFSLFSKGLSDEVQAIPEIAVLSVVISIFYHSLLFPTVYKFGTTKGRIYTMLFVLIPIISTFLIATVMAGVLAAFSITIDSFKYLILAAPLLLILMYIGSIALSIKIYKKKDF